MDARVLGLQGGMLHFQPRALETTVAADSPPEVAALSSLDRLQLNVPPGRARRYALLGVATAAAVVTFANATTCEPGAAPGYCMKRIMLDLGVSTAALVVLRGRQWRDLPLPPPAASVPAASAPAR